MIKKLGVSLLVLIFSWLSTANGTDNTPSSIIIDPTLGFPRVYYHNLQQVQHMLQVIAADNSSFIQYFEYGASPEGLPFMGLKISDNVNLDENEPELMFTAATHGDEPITTEVVLGLIDRLQSGYQNDSRITKMINDHELFFIPIVNPDGFVKSFRLDHLEDPNRSYPYPGKTDNKVPTPSIAALLNFFHSQDIKGSIDFHASGGYILYPWAYTHDPMPLEEALKFKTIAKKMALTNNYAYGPIANIMYLSAGSSADYYYWKNGTLAFGIEIGKSKEPQINEIESYTKEQMESLWGFIENF